MPAQTLNIILLTIDVTGIFCLDLNLFSGLWVFRWLSLEGCYILITQFRSLKQISQRVFPCNGLRQHG
jgi:hypothetical protein